MDTQGSMDSEMHKVHDSMSDVDVKMPWTVPVVADEHVVIYHI